MAQPNASPQNPAQRSDASAGPPGTWSELLKPEHLGVALVMAGGVLLYAMNIYFTAALMPTITASIGGMALYAWVTTAFVLAAILGTLLVSRVLGASGPRKSYLLAFMVFAAGAAANAASPSMEVLIVARAAQGLGGGFLVGLGYAVIRSTLPPRLWGHGAALTASMWGVGALVGPLSGGAFAQMGQWRLAYAVIAAATILLAAIATRALPGLTQAQPPAGRLPVVSLALLVAAAAAISLTAVVPAGPAVLALMMLGAVLLILFVLTERKAAAKILPAAAYQAGNKLKWLLLTAALVSAAVMAEAFIPLFGQQIGGLSPLWAGLLGAALSIGWVAGQILIVSVRSKQTQALAIQAGPVLLTACLVLFGLLLTPAPSFALILACYAILTAGGLGIGIAFPLLSTSAMASSTDPVEGRKAAASVAIVQIMAFAITSAFAGGLMALGQGSMPDAGHYVIFGISAITALGIITARLASR